MAETGRERHPLQADVAAFLRHLAQVRDASPATVRAYEHLFTEEDPANCASECMRPMVSVMP